MAVAVVMPRLSDTMKEGKVAKWRKAEGDAVKKGDVLLDVETDKATLEVQAFESGVLRKILVPEGKTVRIGTNIGVIAGPEEDISKYLAAKPEAAPPPKAAAPPPAPKAPPEQAPPKEAPPKEPPAKEAPAKVAPLKEAPPEKERIKISPLARRIAAEKGISVEAIKGTGPGGRIVQKDVEAAAPEAPGQERELSPLAKTLAARVTASKQQVPHFYMTVEADMGETIKMRASLNAVDPEAPKITFNDIVLKATALALRKHPEMNASFAGDKVVLHQRVDLGIAVALEDGVVVAVLRNCAEKGLATISAEARDLVERARAKRLKPEEYSGSTFTVSNAGMYDVENFAAIINPPEGGILAVSSIRKTPAVVNDEIVIAHRMKMTVSADHRIVSGVHAARFLNEVRRILENPLNLVL